MKENPLEYFDLTKGAPTRLSMHFQIVNSRVTEFPCEAPIRKGNHAGKVIRVFRDAFIPDIGMVKVGLSRCIVCEFRQIVLLGLDGTMYIGEEIDS